MCDILGDSGADRDSDVHGGFGDFVRVSSNKEEQGLTLLA